ncbi:hypothetical protein, partial [Microcoleus sp. PH2017_30_WIL_O_A]|uniref:hypothetical protein n=1 Tax=Microcoleus sp. PH2017_30_WIL_O_A TaxID=2798840 RepID=UPI0025D81C72
IRLFITPILGLKGRGHSQTVNCQLSTVNCQLLKRLWGLLRKINVPIIDNRYLYRYDSLSDR